MLTQLTINRYRRSDNLTIPIVPQMSAMAIKEQLKRSSNLLTILPTRISLFIQTV